MLKWSQPQRGEQDVTTALAAFPQDGIDVVTGGDGTDNDEPGFLCRLGRSNLATIKECPDVPKRHRTVSNLALCCS